MIKRNKAFGHLPHSVFSSTVSVCHHVDAQLQYLLTMRHKWPTNRFKT
jgi:hypothetical protein